MAGDLLKVTTQFRSNCKAAKELCALVTDTSRPNNAVVAAAAIQHGVDAARAQEFVNGCASPAELKRMESWWAADGQNVKTRDKDALAKGATAAKVTEAQLAAFRKAKQAKKKAPKKKAAAAAAATSSGAAASATEDTSIEVSEEEKRKLEAWWASGGQKAEKVSKKAARKAAATVGVRAAQLTAWYKAKVKARAAERGRVYPSKGQTAAVQAEVDRAGRCKVSPVVATVENADPLRGTEKALPGWWIAREFGRRISTHVHTTLVEWWEHAGGSKLPKGSSVAAKSARKQARRIQPARPI